VSSRVFETYEEADQNRDPDHEMVCGVRMEDDSARYFVLPRDVSDQAAADRAFEIRNGRPVSSYERWLQDIVLSRRVKETVDA
jgi:hypothetical protein